MVRAWIGLGAITVGFRAGYVVSVHGSIHVPTYLEYVYKRNVITVHFFDWSYMFVPEIKKWQPATNLTRA